MEKVASIAELIVENTDWSVLREATGTSEDVGRALAQLIDAPTAERATEAYWRIENHAVVQGELFEVAEACTSVLVAALADTRPRHVRVSTLDLLFQILSGDRTPSGAAPPDIVERCRRAAREGLWGLVREAVAGEREAAWDVLELAGLGDDRLERLRVAVQEGRSRLDGSVRKLV